MGSSLSTPICSMTLSQIISLSLSFFMFVMEITSDLWYRWKLMCVNQECPHFLAIHWYKEVLSLSSLMFSLHEG